MAVLPIYIREGDWRDWYAVNAMSLSSHCRARGRYEIALELHDIGTEWYERAVVLKREPGDTAENRKTYRQVLADYKADRAEFALLMATRTRLVDAVGKRQDGVDRNKLKSEIHHQGSTTFGTICNQLERGGWIRQNKDGKNNLLFPASSRLASDQEFIETEIPTPAELGRRAEITPPIATIDIFPGTSKGRGCIVSVLAVSLLLFFASRVIVSFAAQLRQGPMPKSDDLMYN
jgi:hypothetical protein